MPALLGRTILPPRWALGSRCRWKAITLNYRRRSPRSAMPAAVTEWLPAFTARMRPGFAGGSPRDSSFAPWRARCTTCLPGCKRTWRIRAGIKAWPRPLIERPPRAGSVIKRNEVLVAKYPVYVRGIATEPKVALTFDDGPNPPRTEQLLEILAETGSRATFLTMGKWAERFPRTVDRVIA